MVLKFSSENIIVSRGKTTHMKKRLRFSQQAVFYSQLNDSYYNANNTITLLLVKNNILSVKK